LAFETVSVDRNTRPGQRKFAIVETVDGVGLVALAEIL
jgi:hypothetical protein